jgi:hypothetical protein
MEIEAYVPGRDPVDAVIVKSSIAHWQKPYEDQQVPAALQDEILSKVLRNFDRRGLKYRIEP